MGSRGSRTYQSSPSNSPYQAKPIERSATPASNPAAASPGAAPQPVAPQRPSFFGSNPFLSSLAGGFIGAGLFGMLFGGGSIGGMGSPMGAALGGFLQIALLVGLGLMAYRWFNAPILWLALQPLMAMAIAMGQRRPQPPTALAVQILLPFLAVLAWPTTTAHSP